jgi:hypothetical protein
MKSLNKVQIHGDKPTTTVPRKTKMKDSLRSFYESHPNTDQHDYVGYNEDSSEIIDGISDPNRQQKYLTRQNFRVRRQEEWDPYGKYSEADSTIDLDWIKKSVRANPNIIVSNSLTDGFNASKDRHLQSEPSRVSILGKKDKNSFNQSKKSKLASLFANQKNFNKRDSEYSLNCKQDKMSIVDRTRRYLKMKNSQEVRYDTLVDAFDGSYE